MTRAVVLVGPMTVSGPCPVRPECVSAAVASIDDQFAVLDERPIDVDRLLHDVFASAVGDADDIVLVFPGWWPTMRVERVRAACKPATARRRPDVLRGARGRAPDAVVEIAADLVIAATDDCVVVSVPRLGAPVTVADVVAQSIPTPASVLVDIPAQVPGGRELASMIAGRLRSRGAEVELVGDHHVRRAARQVNDSQHRYRKRWPWAVAVGTVVLAVAWLLHPDTTSGRVRVVVEGRVAAEVPADWIIERVTAGQGSRRLHIQSPDGGYAILIVQSPGTPDMAESLDVALQHESPEVFSDFNAADHRAGRAVASYTETREGRVIEWAVFLDGTVRIAIGCQSPTPGTQHREACDHAIQSARGVS